MIAQETLPERQTGGHLTDLACVLVRQLRPRQWLKNLVCFAGLIFSGRLFSPEHMIPAIVGFGAFCCGSSAVYIFNDWVDHEKDRQNPRTGHRPLATGVLPIWLAGVAFLSLVAGAILGSVSLGRTPFLVMAAYGLINVFYSLKLKQTVIADVICIALGFVLRAAYGAYAVQVVPTAWILLCMFFLALFLGFAKRRAELEAFGRGSVRIRSVLNSYAVGYLDLLLAMTAATTILSYGLFTVAPRNNPTLIVTIVPVVYCVCRYLLLVIVCQGGQSPEDVVLADPMLWIGILTWLLLCTAILYGDVQLFAETAAWHSG